MLQRYLVLTWPSLSLHGVLNEKPKYHTLIVHRIWNQVVGHVKNKVWISHNTIWIVAANIHVSRWWWAYTAFSYYVVWLIRLIWVMAVINRRARRKPTYKVKKICENPLCSMTQWYEFENCLKTDCWVNVVEVYQWIWCIWNSMNRTKLKLS